MSTIETVAHCVNKLEFVTINPDAIQNFASEISQEDFQEHKLKLSTVSWSLEEQLMLITYFNAMNFCFWAEKDQPKWTIVVNGEKYDGAIALYKALEQKAQADRTFLIPGKTAIMPFQEFCEIVAGNVHIPLINDRYEQLTRTARILADKYDATVIHLLEKTNYSADLLLQELNNEFPTFKDTQVYKGVQIDFLKRAQLHIKMIDDQLLQYNHQPLTHLTCLTAIADYKVPQMLRFIGLMSYTQELAVIVDSQTLIEKDSPYEIEIRIANVWVIELLRQHLSQRFNDITCPDIDTLLWVKSQNNSQSILPYHRTYTTAY